MHPLDSLTSDWADALFETAPVPMAIVAPDHSFVRCNAAYCELTGYSRSELLKRRWQSITHPDDLSGDQSGADTAQQDKNHPHYSIEKRYITKRGDVVWVHLYVRGIWGDGKFQCYFVTAALHTLTRNTGQPAQVDVKPPEASVGSIVEWVKAHPKDALIITMALMLFLGRDAAIDVIKMVIVK